MDEYKKYPIHGVWLIPHFRVKSLISSRFIKIIHSIAGMDGCKLFINIAYPGARNAFIRPQIEFGPTSEQFDRIVSQQFLRIVNENPGKSIVYEKDPSDPYYAPFYWDILYLKDIVKKENGWLKDGALKIEYGVYVERVKLRGTAFCKFNFWDPLFDCEEKQHMITLKAGDGELLYTPKQLLTFQSPKYYTVPPDWNVVDQKYNFKKEKMEICLQLAHGVRISLKKSKLKSIIPIARSLKLYNAVHYCEYQLMTFEESVQNLKFAFEFNTRHYSIHLMKKLESREELKEILKEMDIQKMSGESMKQCTRFFFDGKI